MWTLNCYICVQVLNVLCVDPYLYMCIRLVIIWATTCVLDSLSFHDLFQYKHTVVFYSSKLSWLRHIDFKFGLECLGLSSGTSLLILLEKVIGKWD